MWSLLVELAQHNRRGGNSTITKFIRKIFRQFEKILKIWLMVELPDTHTHTHTQRERERERERKEREKRERERERELSCWANSTQFSKISPDLPKNLSGEIL